MEFVSWTAVWATLFPCTKVTVSSGLGTNAWQVLNVQCKQKGTHYGSLWDPCGWTDERWFMILNWQTETDSWGMTLSIQWHLRKRMWIVTRISWFMESNAFLRLTKTAPISPPWSNNSLSTKKQVEASLTRLINKKHSWFTIVQFQMNLTNLCHHLRRLDCQCECVNFKELNGAKIFQCCTVHCHTYCIWRHNDNVFLCSQIDWNQSAEALHNWIRGNDKVPGSWAEVDGQVQKEQQIIHLHTFFVPLLDCMLECSVLTDFIFSVYLQTEVSLESNEHHTTIGPNFIQDLLCGDVIK